MNGRLSAVALVAPLVALSLLTSVGSSAAADDATLLRVFLTDGTSLVSYGEFARVADRVVFSMPTASLGVAPGVALGSALGSAAATPPLQLVNLPADRVDWSRTNRYTDSARAARYVDMHGEEDYARLSTEVARALDEVIFTTDAARRLAIVERARKTLAEWPERHFNYRLNDVRQMLVLLDEAIADLRVSAGGERFDLSLVALVGPPEIGRAHV